MSAAQKLPPSLSDLLYKLSLNSSSPSPSPSFPSPPPHAVLDFSDAQSLTSLRTSTTTALSRRIHDDEQKQKRHHDAEDDDDDDAPTPSSDPRKDALQQGFVYVDPLTTPAKLRLRSPTARSTSAATEDEEERRWTELERREEREKMQAKREEKKEPPPHTSAPSRPAPSSSKPAAASRPAKVSFEWLLQRCESFTSQSNQAGLSSFDLASSALHLLQSSASDERLQSELLDLLGLEAMDLIGELLSHRAAIKLISKSELNPIPFSLSAFIPTSSSPLPSSQPPPSTRQGAAPPQLLGVTVISQRERELDKARRKEDRRMARHSVRDPSSDAVAARQRAADAVRLEEQATSLDEWRSGAIHARGTSALPAGSKRTEHKGYEEVYIPPMFPSAFDTADLVPISALDAWARPAFPNTTHLNRIQSRCFTSAYKHNNNVLVCAPTGAGKTNIAMLTVLHECALHIESGVLRKGSFKIVYVAPMKALAQEVQATFQRRLAYLGLVVKELTGDMQLTKREIAETQIIITTPEKWDVMTRKSGDGSLHSQVRLLIIDEVHLLHEDRGPVIEILVARTLRLVETSQEMCRIVGLSATLPNYADVANFLGVNPSTGLFYFDGSYRPVPLTQYYVGVQEKAQHKRLERMNEICYKKVLTSVKAGHQVMVFVHSRRDTVKTAKFIKEMAGSLGENHFLLPPAGDAEFSLAERRVAQARNAELSELFASGLAMHHAGMVRPHRALVEKYFAAGLVKVLCCTATLAWGVNLPAHTVIIKGTQIYDSAKGGFVDVGMLDVMQIFGRAGRPQFDTSGEGTLITEHDKLGKYLALINAQLPIESQFIQALPDHLNAEIILGTVTTLSEAITWLGYTYLHIRMMKNPMHYGIQYEELAMDPQLVGRRRSLILDAIKTLMRCRMCKFDPSSGQLYPTDIGRVSSHYYIHHESVEQYNALLKPFMNDQEVFHLISVSKEFTQIKVREEELPELEAMARKYAPIKIQGGLESTTGKANLLLQVYISNGYIDNATLISDSYFITQSAGRIMRALFEMVLKRGKSFLASRFLTIAKMIDKRLWDFQHPLRQFIGPHLKLDAVMRLEQPKSWPVEELIDMTAGEIGDILRHQTAGAGVLQAVRQLPYLEMDATVQPITRSVLRVTLVLTPAFDWYDRLHGSVEPFWVWVEDADSEHIYHTEYFLLHRLQAQQPHTLSFTIPIFDPVPPQYFVQCHSDRWIGSQSTLAISFQHLILPDMHPPHTALLDLHPLSKRALYHERAESMYRFTHFNPIQTQCFHALYHSDENILLGAPTGSGKTVVAELAMLRLWSAHPGMKAVYIAPLKALARERIEDWTRDGSLKGALGKRVVELTGDTAPDAAAIQHADLLITTPEKWDGISRSWKTKAYVKRVGLVIIDEIHLLGADRGPILEVIVSRMRYISAHTSSHIRVVGLSTALANARDLADWLGIDESGLFNFPPSVRPVPLTVHIAGFPGKHYCPRMATMNKPTYAAIMTHSRLKPALVFVSSRRQTRLTALDLIAFSAADGNPRKFLHMKEEELELILDTVRDPHLKHMLAFGIGMHHAGLIPADRLTVEHLYLEQKIQVLVCTSTLAWGVNFPAHLVVIKGTEYYDAATHRYVDFPITDVLQMMGRAGRPQFDDDGVAVVLVHESKKNFYLNFLHSPFPVESSLASQLHDHVNAEVVAGTIRSTHDAVQYLTWTFLYRRLLLNPSYYGVEDATAEGLNTFLLTLVKDTLGELEHAGLLRCHDAVEATALGRIASYYYLHYTTMTCFMQRLSATADLIDVLGCLSWASEYSELPVRHNEDGMNEQLAKRCRWPVPKDWLSPHVKANLLFQCVLSRAELPISDYYTDTRSVLDQCIRILQAMVDIACEFAWGSTVTRVILLMQCIVQGRWPDDSTLANVPHCDARVIASLWDDGVEVLPQLMAMDAAAKAAAYKRAGLKEKQVDDIAAFLRRMPSVDMTVEVRITPGTGGSKRKRPAHIASITEALSDTGVLPHATADDEEEEEEEDRSRAASTPGMLRVVVHLHRTNADSSTKILSPTFNKPKDEGWWLLLTHPASGQLLLCKRVNGLRSRLTATLVCPMPARGVWEYCVLLLSDSYLGLDQERVVRIESEEDEVIELPIAHWSPNLQEEAREEREQWLEQAKAGKRDWAEQVIAGADDTGAGKAGGGEKTFKVEFDDDDEGY